MSHADKPVEDSGGQSRRGSGATDGGDGGDRTGERDDPDSDRGGRPCPVCDRPMSHRHCKYVCPQHGVVYDCADTFY